MNSLYLLTFLGALMCGINLVAMPLYLINKFQVTSFYLGLFIAINSMIYAIISMIFGNLCNKISQKKLILISFFLSIIISFLVTIVKSINQFFFLLCIWAIPWGMFWTPLSSWISHKSETKQLTKNMGFYYICICSGVTIGSFISGVFFKIYFELPYFVIIVLGITNILILFKEPCLLKDHNLQKQTIKKKILWTDNLFLYLVWMLHFISIFVISMIVCHFPKLACFLKIDVVIISTFISFIPLFQGVMVFFILSKTTFWQYHFSPFFILQGIVCLGLIGITLNNNIYLWGIVFLILGILKSFTYFLSIFHSANSSENRSQKLGIHEAINGISSSIGPLLGGVVASYYGLKAPYFLCFVILTISTIIEIGILKFISNKKLKEVISQ